MQSTTKKQFPDHGNLWAALRQDCVAARKYVRYRIAPEGVSSQRTALINLANLRRTTTLRREVRRQ
jgi:hypothetical protein